MNEKARHICDTFIERGCSTVCDLAEACYYRHDDTAQKFADRMDKAAELVVLKGWD